MLLGLLTLTGCKPDETLTAYGAADRDWVVQEWHGTPLWPELTIRFEPGGAVTGTGPCNSFTATQSVPYPWIALQSFVHTEAACPALATEKALFEALQSAILVEVLGDVMILTDEADRELLFNAAPRDQ